MTSPLCLSRLTTPIFTALRLAVPSIASKPPNRDSERIRSRGHVAIATALCPSSGNYMRYDGNFLTFLDVAIAWRVHRYTVTRKAFLARVTVLSHR
jgi:hypothetical protein